MNEVNEMSETIRWQNAFHQKEKGEMEISVPYHRLMTKCEREITVIIR